jgi:hypothetical protein
MSGEMWVRICFGVQKRWAGSESSSPMPRSSFAALPCCSLARKDPLAVKDPRFCPSPVPPPPASVVYSGGDCRRAFSEISV